jgi:hypothetical protein
LNHYSLKNRVITHFHPNIQFFTTFSMWQGGPSP